MGTGEVNRPGASGENPVQGQQQPNTLSRRVDQVGRAQLQAPAPRAAPTTLRGRVTITFRRLFGLMRPIDWFVEQGLVARIEDLPGNIYNQSESEYGAFVDLCREVQAQEHFTSIYPLFRDIRIVSYLNCPYDIRILEGGRARYQQLIMLNPNLEELDQALEDLDRRNIEVDIFTDANFTQFKENITNILEREETASWYDLIHAHLMARQVGSQLYNVCYECLQLMGYRYSSSWDRFRNSYQESANFHGWSEKERICYALLNDPPEMAGNLQMAVNYFPRHDKIAIMQLAATFATMEGAEAVFDRLTDLPNCNEVARLLLRCLDPVAAANRILNNRSGDLFALLFGIEGASPGMSLNEALRQALSSEATLADCQSHERGDIRELLPRMRYGASVLERIKNHPASVADWRIGWNFFHRVHLETPDNADSRAKMLWGGARAPPRVIASEVARAPEVARVVTTPQVARVNDPPSAEEQLNQLYHDHRSNRPMELITLDPNQPTLPQMEAFLAKPATPLQISYRDSPGIDAGGLTRQALQACSDELLSYFADTLERSDYDNELHLKRTAEKPFQLGHLCYLFVKNDIPLPTEQVLSRSIFQQGSRFTASQLVQKLWSTIVNQSSNLETLYRHLHPTSEGIKLEDMGIENQEQLKEEILAEEANFQFARGFSARGELPITAKSSDIFVVNADLRATILASLRFGERVDSTSIEFLTKWIQEAPLPNLTKFMRIISGANALPRDKTILIIHSDTVNYYAHSCARQLDLGRGITDFEMWKMGFENMLDDPGYSDR